MRKKRILFCSEATFLNTGYATYAREVLKYLHSTGKYELAELASYGERNDPRANNLPWLYYGVMPNAECEPKSTEEEKQSYQSSPTNQFGEFIFEEVCLDFFPDIVCDIRDFWMLDFVERSPFRPYFKWCIMPTVDASPQARQWLATYASADGCFTYSDWAGGVLQEQGGGRINYLGSAPPSAHPAYQPIEDKDAHKKKYGIDPEYKIIGTVMRNQRRKLYPDLFEAFKKFLDNSDDKKYYLYCHTSYPDLGWNIPELLQEYELSSHVMFTYICSDTGKPFPSLFKGAITESPYTGKFGASLSSVKQGASYEDLASIINLFDVYVQYANCEGFGLPQVEAAACGVPVMGTDYSAMESVIRKLKGVPITPKGTYKELETGCFRAVPDNDLAAQKFKDFFDQPKSMRRRAGHETYKAFMEHYQWHFSGKRWEDFFDSVDIDNQNPDWYSAPRIRSPEPKPTDFPQDISHHQLSQWLISHVLCEPERLNTFFEARICRDLLYRSATGSTGGMYFNESSAAFEGNNTRQPFNLDIAYDHLSSLCNRRNQWEQRRWEKVNKTP